MIEELERRKVLEPALNVRVGFGSSLRFLLAYLIVNVIDFLFVALVVILIIYLLVQGFGTFLSNTAFQYGAFPNSSSFEFRMASSLGCIR